MRLEVLQDFNWAFGDNLKSYKAGEYITVTVEKEAEKMIAAGLAKKLEEKQMQPNIEDKMMRPQNKKTKSKK